MLCASNPKSQMKSTDIWDIFIHIVFFQISMRAKYYIDILIYLYIYISFLLFLSFKKLYQFYLLKKLHFTQTHTHKIIQKKTLKKEDFLIPLFHVIVIIMSIILSNNLIIYTRTWSIVTMNHY